MKYKEILIRKYNYIIGYIGVILLGLSIALLLPLIFLFIFGEESILVRSFLIPAVFSALLGFIMSTPIRKGNNDSHLTLHEGGVIVVLSWLMVTFISAFPFLLSGELNFTQALFESVSGWTTTGLSVVDESEIANTLIFWRSLMQYLGGAGIAVTLLAAIIGPSGGMGLYSAEGRSDKLLPNVFKSIKLIIIIYLGYTFSGIILYMIVGMPWFDSIIHSFSALSTGGFSSRPESIGAFDSLAIELVTIILMILGTTNFAAHHVFLRGKIKEFFKIGEIKFMFILMGITIPVVIFVALFPLYGNFAESLRFGTFELISSITTTGYSTGVDYDSWGSFAVFVIIVLMIFGGGAGSTAGGVKLIRIYVLFKSVVWHIQEHFLPKNIVRENYILKPGEKFYVYQRHITQFANFLLLYLATYILGVLIFLAHGFQLEDSMFEFASTLGTVGLSVGLTSPDAPLFILWTQIFGMLLGRLELYIIFFAFIRIIKDIKQLVLK
ncbi:TrkH family potassium uptake protein [Natranaerobius thermophilus]|nr:TrkH family potassium uptake protein [Natranaerobius thermophilus]